MYGASGLFGDLPSKKNSSSKVSNLKDVENKKTERGTGGVVASVVSGGTSNVLLSFVPAAALKRKKPLANSSKVHSSSTTNNNINSSTKKKLRSELVARTEKSSIGETGIETSITSETITITTTKKIDNQSKQLFVVNIHGGTNSNSETDIMSLPSAITTRNKSDTNTRNDDIKSSKKITDPYDPFVPNDLLEYWEKEAATKQRERLERDTREALERQKSIRKKIEEERSELQKSGNYSTLLEQERIHQQQQQHQQDNNNATMVGNNISLPGLGRGRGRGLSNLPAWLVEKQRKEAEGATISMHNQSNNNDDDSRYYDSGSA